MMEIPIIRIPFGDGDLEFVANGLRDIASSGTWTMGKYTDQFEAAFANFTGARYAVACSNGTAALELVLRGLGIERKSVIVPTNTFLATAFAVLHSGNRVIFADSSPETMCLDPQDVRGRLTDDTAAVILVHIGGVITPAVYELRQLCRERNLYLIEDSAHAHGCSLDGKAAGTLGVAAAFSFFPTKVLTTGEGGIVTTGDEGLAARMRILRNHGKDPAMGNRMSEVGHNFRLSEVGALLGLRQLANAEDLIAARRSVAAFYDTALTDIPGIQPLSLPRGLHSTYYKYIAFVDEQVDRNALKRRLRERYRVRLTGEVYADLCHTEPVWERYTYCGRRRVADGMACHHWPTCGCEERQDDFPGADRISLRHFCLPVYPGLSEAELEYTVSSLRNAVGEPQL